MQSNVQMESYFLEVGEVDLTAASKTYQIIGPKGCVGFVRDFIVNVTTSVVGTSSVPEIIVGISSGDATYGRYRLGTTASNGYATGVHRASQEAAITGNPPRTLADYTGHVVLDGAPWQQVSSVGSNQNPTGRIPKDTAATISVVVASGSPAGKAYAQVLVEWLGSAYK